MASNSFHLISLSMCLLWACAFPVEMDPTRVCSGKGAVTLRASPAYEENQNLSSPCPQDAEQPESKCNGFKVNWNMLPHGKLI